MPSDDVDESSVIVREEDSNWDHLQIGPLNLKYSGKHIKDGIIRVADDLVEWISGSEPKEEEEKSNHLDGVAQARDVYASVRSNICLVQSMFDSVLFDVSMLHEEKIVSIEKKIQVRREAIHHATRTFKGCVSAWDYVEEIDDLDDDEDLMMLRSEWDVLAQELQELFRTFIIYGTQKIVHTGANTTTTVAIDDIEEEADVDIKNLQECVDRVQHLLDQLHKLFHLTERPHLCRHAFEDDEEEKYDDWYLPKESDLIKAQWKGVDMVIDREQVREIAQNALEKVMTVGIDGDRIPGSRELAADFADPNVPVEQRIDKMLRQETGLHFGAAFLSCAAGIFMLPTLPIAIGYKWTAQARLCGAIAILYGYSWEDPRVRTLVLMCVLCEVESVKALFQCLHLAHKNIRLTRPGWREEDDAMLAISKIPVALLPAINEQLAERLVRKEIKELAVGGFIMMLPIYSGILLGAGATVAMHASATTARRIFRYSNHNHDVPYQKIADLVDKHWVVTEEEDDEEEEEELNEDTNEEATKDNITSESKHEDQSISPQ